jgi:hypothetical protein
LTVEQQVFTFTRNDENLFTNCDGAKSLYMEADHQNKMDKGSHLDPTIYA